MSSFLFNWNKNTLKLSKNDSLSSITNNHPVAFQTVTRLEPMKIHFGSVPSVKQLRARFRHSPSPTSLISVYAQFRIKRTFHFSRVTDTLFYASRDDIGKMEARYRIYEGEIELFYTVDIIFIFQKRSPSHFVTTCSCNQPFVDANISSIRKRSCEMTFAYVHTWTESWLGCTPLGYLLFTIFARYWVDSHNFRSQLHFRPWIICEKHILRCVYIKH